METTLIQYLKAGYSLFYIQSEEQEETIAFLQKELTTWKESISINVWGYGSNNVDPMEPFLKLQESFQEAVFPQAIILKNYNWFLFEEQVSKAPNKEIVQMMLDTMPLFKTQEKRVITCIISSVSYKEGLPKELIKDFVEITFPLPTREDIEKILDETIETAKEVKTTFPIPNKQVKEALINSAVGMKHSEIQNSMFLSVVKNGELKVSDIVDRRTAYLKGIAGIKYIQYKETFKSLKGYENLKEFVSITLPNPESKGLCLLGPSGTGKSHFSKACSGEFDIPMLTLEMAELQGGIVGQTEENVRRIIEVIKSFIEVDSKGVARGRLIIFIDEFEKGLSGTGNSNRSYSSDSMNDRANSQLLKFMQDRPDGIYFLATCNSINLPPEYLRAERWDTAPFFIDLPQENEREEILEYYMEQYQVPVNEVKANTLSYTEGWSGSELKTLCRLYNIMNKKESIKLIDIMKNYIVPISVTKKEEIYSLKKWAEGRTIPASKTIINKYKRIK
ncbi:AAA family ATPase [Candidatus Gracilibacteria bacterium]|nr:AAA family ATPase [Candidatus Gracilibacteria bacterium]